MNNETTIKIDVLFGYVQPEMRYVQTGPDSVECQSRRRVFDQSGVCTETTTWKPLSRMTGVPAYMMPMVLASR